MPDALLVTKLTIPPTRPGVVSRPRLIAVLDSSLSSKLTLVSAPAGFGKTTLLSAWADGSSASVGWVALDDEDNDPSRFLAYFVTALRAFSAEAGGQVLTMLQARTSPSIGRLGTALINDLAQFTDELVIVLDDYHIIESRPVHDTVTFLLDHLPPQTHLVISTRSDPPLPLAKLRGAGELVELRAADLRFTPQEAAAFLEGAMGVSLSQDMMQALDAQIEGWAVGLQLAGLALKGETDRQSFVEDFSGSHRYIIDYLTDEVMQRQPADVRSFLQETSILDGLNPALCDAVVTRQDSQEMLARLEQANLFLVALDNRREWYRYHHLFRDALHFRLQEQTSGEHVKKLHRRAATWYGQNDFTDEALHHWLEAGAYIEAADLMQAVGYQMLSRGQLGKLRRWIELLPETVVRKRPWLCIQYAWVLNLMGQLDEMALWLQDAEQAAADADPQLAAEIKGNIATVRAGAARKQNNSEAAIRYLREALENLPEDDALVRSSAHFNLGSTYLDMGKVVGAEQELRAAVRDAERIESLYTLIAGKSYLADAYALRGKLHRAASLYQEAIEDGLARNDGKPMPLNGYAYSGWGQILYEQNDLNTAESKLNTALELGELLSDWTIVRRALPSLARLQQATRRADAAEASWHKAFELAQEYGDQPGAAYLEALRAHMWLVQAAWESDNAALAFAHRWAASYRAEQHRATDYRATLAQMTLAWAETTQGQADEAATRLERVAEAAQTDGRTDCLIRALACLALAQGQLGQTAESQSTLRRAVELAAPEGYCRTFVDYGPPMHDLLKQLADNHPELAYATRLPGTFPSQIGTTSSTALDEPLNEREQAVLRLIAAGLSNREIADELYLSVNTIKWYTTQIYGKLAVSKRAEAVDRAHDLGIL